MATAKVQVVIPATSGLPEDNASNTWYFDVTPVDVTNATIICDALKDFYEEVPMSNKQALNGVWLAKVYDWPGTQPNYPVHEQTWQMTRAVNSDPLPAQCSCVLSFRNTALIPGVPRARRRGRVYIPWLAETYMDSAGNVASTYKDDLFAGLTAMETTLGTIQHVVYSEAEGTSFPISEYVVDNSVDIVRRRKQDPTTVWTRP